MNYINFLLLTFNETPGPKATQTLAFPQPCISPRSESSRHKDRTLQEEGASPGSMAQTKHPLPCAIVGDTGSSFQTGQVLRLAAILQEVLGRAPCACSSEEFCQPRSTDFSKG